MIPASSRCAAHVRQSQLPTLWLSLSVPLPRPVKSFHEDARDGEAWSSRAQHDRYYYSRRTRPKIVNRSSNEQTSRPRGKPRRREDTAADRTDANRHSQDGRREHEEDESSATKTEERRENRNVEPVSGTQAEARVTEQHAYNFGDGRLHIRKLWSHKAPRSGFYDRRDIPQSTVVAGAALGRNLDLQVDEDDFSVSPSGWPLPLQSESFENADALSSRPESFSRRISSANEESDTTIDPVKNAEHLRNLIESFEKTSKSMVNQMKAELAKISAEHSIAGDQNVLQNSVHEDIPSVLEHETLHKSQPMDDASAALVGGTKDVGAPANEASATWISSDLGKTIKKSAPISLVETTQLEAEVNEQVAPRSAVGAGDLSSNTFLPSTEKAKSSTTTLSLFEELFPTKPEPKTPGQDRRKPSATNARSENGKRHMSVMRNVHTPSPDRLSPAPLAAQVTDDMTILFFSNASRSLIDDDFRRLIPRGQHMQDWQNVGAYDRVIPGRAPGTLEREDHYYIVFPTSTAARHYLTNVQHMHKLANKYTQTSLDSPIAPPPGHLIDGIDVDAVRNAYAICYPADFPPQMRELQKPYKRQLVEIAKAGGFPGLTSIRHAHRVLLRVQGAPLIEREIRNFVHLEGKLRALAYALVDADDAICKVEVDRKATHEPVPDVFETMFEDDDGIAREKPNAPPRDESTLWLVSFKSDAEATRFADAVHGRIFPCKQLGIQQDLKHWERTGKVTAEVLW